MSIGIGILITIIVAIMLIGSLTAPNMISFTILTDIFEFVLAAMKSFDWLIAYNVQLSILVAFITIESALLVFNLIRWIIELTAGKK